MPMPDPFAYQQPNETTLPRYKAIVAAWRKCHAEMNAAIDPQTDGASVAPLSPYEAINAACRAFYDVIQAVCPPSADRSAAERCVRLARMKANESLRPMLKEYPAEYREELRKATLMDLLTAKHQAAASIALALPNELPEWSGG